MKKVLTFLIILAMTLSVFSIEVCAENLKFGEYTYKIVNDSICILRYSGYKTDIIVPSVIEGKSVTKISAYAFEDSDNINSITIPKSVTDIDDMDFGYYRDIDDSYIILSDMLIKCFANSVGEKYAKINSFDYEILSDAKPTDVTGFKVSSVADKSVKLTWNKVNGASGYIIYQMKNGKWSRVLKTKTNVCACTVSNLDPGKSYSFAVKAYRNVAGQEISSKSYPTITTETKLPAVTNFTVSSVSDTAVKLTWKNVSGIDGYILYQYDTLNKKWVRIAKITSPITTYNVKNLKENTSYKFAVKAYKTINGKEISSVSYPTVSVKTKTSKSTITVKNGVTYVNGVLVVNKTYSLPSSYNPGGLTSETYNAFLEMQKGASKSNITLTVCSGFRSYSYQNYLYNYYVSRDGKANADRYSARAGHSEHQTGLAIDVNNASSWFNGTKEALWLEKHCSEYGFILRYPKGKESKTGYQYESWHVRYVGKELAKKITDSGLCLEEYFGITSQYK